MNRVWLVTGPPGVGKTTLVREATKGLAAGGFYTEEVRESGTRQGFKLVTLDGAEAMLAHAKIRSPFRVGKYGVDVGSLEQVGVTAVRRAVAGNPIVVIDEIGKMELFSGAFREAVLDAIGSGKKVLATIMLKPHPWADAVKRRLGVELVVLTPGSRTRELGRVQEWLKGGGSHVEQNKPQTSG